MQIFPLISEEKYVLQQNTFSIYYSLYQQNVFYLYFHFNIFGPKHESRKKYYQLTLHLSKILN